MYEKVDSQMQMMNYAQNIDDIPRDGRLPNLARNLGDSFEQPIFGKGRSFETRYTSWGNMEADAFSNNVGNFPAQFGWPFFLLYSFLIIKGFEKLLKYYSMNKNYAFVFLFVIYTLSVGQGFLLTSVFISLLYLRNLDFGLKTHPRYETSRRYTHV